MSVSSSIGDTSTGIKNPDGGRAADGMRRRVSLVRFSISESGRRGILHLVQVRAEIRRDRRGDSFESGYLHRSARKVA